MTGFYRTEQIFAWNLNHAGFHYLKDLNSGVHPPSPKSESASLSIYGSALLVYRITSGSAVERLKERAAALSQNLKIGESSKAVPRAARKCFDFIRIFNKASGSGKQVAGLRFPQSAYTNFLLHILVSQRPGNTCKIIIQCKKNLWDLLLPLLLVMTKSIQKNIMRH